MINAEESTAHQRIPGRTTFLVVLLCWLTILFEGYDVGVMGAILPVLAHYQPWGLSSMQMGALASYALVGMFVGGFFVGTVSDVLGRKKMLILCIAVFSLTMIGAALATTPAWFGVFRVLSGLGLGGVIPVAAALTVEYSPLRRRSLNYGLMYSGYSLGIMCAAIVARTYIEQTSWRVVVGVGALPLLLVPLFVWLLPESIDFLVASGRLDAATRLSSRLGVVQAVALPKTAPAAATGADTDTGAAVVSWRTVLSTLFAPRYLLATVCFWIALFCGMLLVYGLNTWLPQIMRRAGFNLGQSLSFLIVFSVASALGGVVLGRIADHTRTKWTIALAFLAGGCAIFGLSFVQTQMGGYLLVVLAGIGTISSSLILTGFLTGYYPAHARGSAPGWALSFARLGAMAGPLIGGYAASIGLALRWHFGIFAIVAFIATIAVALIPEPRSRRAPNRLEPIAPAINAG